ncbi:MAG: hypothetical protein BroJett029_26940 [Alphaproteobacteria bacterium]|nr:MAG: hypothetical protein BroJett029_26940 [Alphaproteobacteria bacterium]
MSASAEEIRWRRYTFRRLADALDDNGYGSSVWWVAADRARRSGSLADEDAFYGMFRRAVGQQHPRLQPDQREPELLALLGRILRELTAERTLRGMDCTAETVHWGGDLDAGCV